MICRIKPDDAKADCHHPTGIPLAALFPPVFGLAVIPIVTLEELLDDSDDELDWQSREAWWIERCNNAWLEGMLYGLFGGAAMVVAMLLAGWIGWRWL